MSTVGIKIGSEVFAAAGPPAGQRAKFDAVRRQAVLSWSSADRRELRTLGAGPLAPGKVEVTGFVDRVGDSVDVVASDGSGHRAEDLVAAGVAYLSRYMAGVSSGPAAIAISYPAHWEASTLPALQRSLAGIGLSAATLIPECQAILTRAADMRGVPSEGKLAIYDLGGNGLSVTLAQAGSSDPLGRTLRNTDFGGAQADYFLLRHVLGLVEDEAGGLDYEDPAIVRELAVLRDRCRVAKETLSTETATIVDVELGRFADGIRLVRSELQDMIGEPIERTADLVSEALRANGVDTSALAGIVLAGGASAIPLVTEVLSSEFRVPVVRDRDPDLTSALGAAAAVPAEPSQSSTPAGPTPTAIGRIEPAVRIVRTPSEPAGQDDKAEPSAEPRSAGAFPPPPPLPKSTKSNGIGPKRGPDHRSLPFPKIAASAAIFAILLAVGFTLGVPTRLGTILSGLTGDANTTSQPVAPQDAGTAPPPAPTAESQPPVEPEHAVPQQEPQPDVVVPRRQTRPAVENAPDYIEPTPTTTGTTTTTPVTTTTTTPVTTTTTTPVTTTTTTPVTTETTTTEEEDPFVTPERPNPYGIEEDPSRYGVTPHVSSEQDPQEDPVLEESTETSIVTGIVPEKNAG